MIAKYIWGQSHIPAKYIGISIHVKFKPHVHIHLQVYTPQEYKIEKL